MTDPAARAPDARGAGGRHRRWLRRILVAVAALLLLGVGLGAVAALWLHQHAEALAPDRVAAALAGALGRPVRVRAVDLQPWRGRVRVTGLEIARAETWDAGATATLERADLALSLESLWRLALVVRVSLSDLDVDLEAGAGGGEPSVPLVPELFEIGPVTARLASIGLTRGRVRIREAIPGWALEIDGLEGTIRPGAAGLRLVLDARELRAAVAGVETRVAEPSLAARLTPEAVEAERLRGRIDGQPLELAGSVRAPWSAPVADLRVTGRVALGPLLGRLLGEASAVDGLVRVDGTLAGPLSRPDVLARLTSDQVLVQGTSLRDVEIGARWDGATLSLDPVEARIFGHRTRGSLTAAQRPGGGTDLAARLSGVELAGPLARLGTGSVVVDASLDAGVLEVARAEARWKDAALRVSGRLARQGPLGLTLGADVRVETLTPGGDPPVTGQVSLLAEATGTWARPRVTGRLALPSGTLAGMSLVGVDLPVVLTRAPSNPSWMASVEDGTLVLSGVAARIRRAELALQPERLEALGLEAAILAVPVTARGAVTWSGTGTAEATIGPTALERLPGLGTVTGTARATLRVQAGRDGPRARATVGVDGLTVSSVVLGTAEAEIETQDRGVRATVSLPAMAVTARIHADLARDTVIRGEARLAGLPVAPFLARLAPDLERHVAGIVEGRLAFEVPPGAPADGRATAWLRPDLSIGETRWRAPQETVVRWDGGRLSLDPLRVVGPSGALSGRIVLEPARGEGAARVALDAARLPGSLAALGAGRAEVEASLAQGVVQLQRLRASWPAATLEVQGRLSLGGPLALEGRLQGELSRLASAWGASAPEGRATVVARATGRWPDPEVAGEVTLTPVDLGLAPLTSARIPFQLAGSTLRVEGAEARLGGEPLGLSGTLVLAAGVGAPPAPRGRLTLTAPRLALFGWPVRDLRAAVELDPSTLRLASLTATAGGVPVRVSGQWPWSGPGVATAELGPASLAELPIAPPGAGVVGRVRGHLEAQGRHLGDLALTADLRLDDLAAAGLALGDGTASVRVSDRRLGATLTLPARRLTARVEGPLDRAAPLALRAAIERADLAELIRPLSASRAIDVGGSLSGTLDARIPLDRPLAGPATLRIDPLRLTAGGQALRNREPLVLRWDGTQISLATFTLAGGAGSLTLSGRITPGGPLDIRASGRVPLGLLAGLRPEVEGAEGLLTLDGQVTGTTAAPRPSLEGRIREGVLAIRGLGDQVQGLEARLSASPAGLRVEEATARLGTGTLTASGELALAGLTPGTYRATLAGRRISLPPLGGLATTWDADLELAGRGSRGLVSGEARLVRGDYTRELALPAGGSAAPAGGQEPGAGWPLHVVVKLDDNLLVRNRTARLRIGGNLSVEGTTAAPALLGTAEVREGQITFRGRRFQVVSASARLVDPRRLDPFLNAVATARIGPYEVSVRVSGRLGNLAIQLTSSPPLSQDDLLALVVFGATRTQLGHSAPALVAGEAAQRLLADLLGLDLGGLAVESTDVDPFGERGATMGFGTRLTDRAVLSYSQGTDSTKADRRVRLQYELIGPVQLFGEQTLGGGSAGGVVIRLRFR